MTRKLTELERPAVFPGQWIDATHKRATHVGCDTCGWEETGPYGEVRASWLTHTHSPLMDIRRRFAESEDPGYRADVGYLLNLLEDRKAISEEKDA